MSSGELVCTDIAKVYETGKRALSEVSFSVPTSGVFSLIGRNGAGKTHSDPHPSHSAGA